MHRFGKNRWWAFILTSSLVLACWCLRPGGASADGPFVGWGDNGDGGGVPTGTGDPDVPQGPKNSALRRSGTEATYLGARAAGDGTVSKGVWMIRLRVVLQGVKSFYLHY
jgi:hypothetical protein